ncbi:3-dehydroquinate synthase family protein [Streptomyces gamaensis]|uniref:3-dehydroquinate synthase family protein n=1 Tax=Streptomyces gamaensis TaxID=1763542 RepID=A0ABW0YW98_9ACTN
MTDTAGAAEGTRVDVELGERAYPVHIGPGVRALLPGVIAALGARRAVVVSARPPGLLPGTGVPTLTLTARDGEAHKTPGHVASLCREFAQYGLTRADVVVSCGGGTTTDTVGLAAALYHRGVAVVHLPTTLLAQVDASVGGKTAVNLPEGKNLMGAYWQPRAVLCDTGFLRTLPAEEWANGYGELARCHFIGAGELRGLPVHEQIAASVRLKAAVVAADERDTGRRHLLNYGHTLGHALETATGFAVRHGEGVAIGTVFAGLLARALGRVDSARAREHREVVRHYGLPDRLPPGVDVAGLVTLMRRDKKAAASCHGLTFVLDGPRGPEVVPGVPEETVARVLGTMRAETAVRHPVPADPTTARGSRAP